MEVTARSLIDVYQDIHDLTEKYKQGNLENREYFDLIVPVFNEMSISLNEYMNKNSDFIDRMTAKQEEQEEIMEGLMLDDMILRASHAYIERTGQQEEFMKFFEDTLSELSAKQFRKKFHVIETK